MLLILPICSLLSRGRGGTSGFYRGGRGRGLNQGYRGRGGGRGGFQPGRPTGGKKETLKFEGEYDFDKANEEFKEVLEKLQVSFVVFLGWNVNFEKLKCEKLKKFQNDEIT